MVLLVDVNGTDYLADVGFGSTTLTAPLRMRPDVEQQTPHETFRLINTNPGWRLEVQIGDDWRPVYSFDEDEKSIADYVEINDFIQSDSNFRDNVIATRTEKGRRLTLRNTVFRTHTVGGETETRTLGGVAEVKDVLATAFGISLPPAEKLDQALARVVGEHSA
jgi:N-hydroxyarylamine O-acetyltransferase